MVIRTTMVIIAIIVSNALMVIISSTLPDLPGGGLGIIFDWFSQQEVITFFLVNLLFVLLSVLFASHLASAKGMAEGLEEGKKATKRDWENKFLLAVEEGDPLVSLVGDCKVSGRVEITFRQGKPEGFKFSFPSPAERIVAPIDEAD